MKIHIVSEKGGRSNNEDAVRGRRKNETYCFVLADGIGGQDCGEVASELAVNTILDCFKLQPDISSDTLYAYLEAAQHAIAEERAEDPSKRKMGTTAAVLVTDGKTAVWAHCGDSRLYRFRKNKIQEVTDDHSVAFASYLAGEIKYSDIRRSPDQNKLLRSLGSDSKFRPDVSEPLKLPSKSVFLLCSDGLWEYVDEDFMEHSLKKSSSPHDWIMRMLAERKKNAPPDADNYSAIAVFI